MRRYDITGLWYETRLQSVDELLGKRSTDLSKQLGQICRVRRSQGLAFSTRQALKEGGGVIIVGLVVKHRVDRNSGRVRNIGQFDRDPL